uniref:Interleukin-1 receptor antagonist protein n=1 Tax=Terrapene triunguis TaxID=2587831 RepID=A0A674JVW9_9SAUR
SPLMAVTSVCQRGDGWQERDHLIITCQEKSLLLWDLACLTQSHRSEPSHVLATYFPTEVNRADGRSPPPRPLSCISISNWPLSSPPPLQDKKIMDLYQNSREAKRFTFTCSATGSTLRFESVAFPGWYLSTSPRNDQPLRVTNRLGEAEITNFYFKKV